MSVKRIRAAAVGLCILFVGAIAGCVDGTSVQPNPTPSVAAGGLSVEDGLWNMVISRFPGADQPEVALIRTVTAAEMATVQAECLRSAGYEVVLTADDGVQVTGTPDAQQEPLAVAQYICQVQYQVDRQYTDAFTPAELSTLYRYYIDELTPCLEAHGEAIAEIPSLSTFVDTYGSKAWTPYLSVVPGPSWDSLNDACPQWPDGLLG